MHTIWLGKSLQFLCIIFFDMLCLSAISMIFVKILLAVCMLVGMVLGRMLIVVMMGKWSEDSAWC